jgi:O-antigen/teichoic acid export membrane protein
MSYDPTALEARLRSDTGLQQELQRQDTLIYGGLIAGCVAFMQPFLSAPALDLAATVAVVAFSIAIPLLGALLMVNQQAAYRHRRAEARVLSVTKVVGQGLAVLGLAAAFWHVLWIAGVAVIVGGLVAVTIHAQGFIRLEEPRPPSPGDQGQ